jgi:hypothetical protein
MVAGKQEPFQSDRMCVAGAYIGFQSTASQASWWLFEENWYSALAAAEYWPLVGCYQCLSHD